MNDAKTELISAIQSNGTAGLTEWIEKHKVDVTPIDLSGADLNGVNLTKAPLAGANLSDANLTNAKLSYAELTNADLSKAQLRDAVFVGANLAKAQLRMAQIDGTNFETADLSGASLHHAEIDQASFEYAQLNMAKLWSAKTKGTKSSFRHASMVSVEMLSANLPRADFSEANLSLANFALAKLDGAKFDGANLNGASFKATQIKGVQAKYAVVDGATIFDGGCKVDIHTDFTGTAVESVRIAPSIRSALDYNVRRKQWEEYYRLFPVKGFFWRSFWSVSDYGVSIFRIVGTFAGFSIFFALIYLLPTPAPEFAPKWLPKVDWKPLLSNLNTIEVCDGEDIHITGVRLWTRSLYFSVVTMTTLGFGDIHANPESGWGHWLLMAQVLCGYVLLGAILTRLSILFQSKSAV